MYASSVLLWRDIRGKSPGVGIGEASGMRDWGGILVAPSTGGKMQGNGEIKKEGIRNSIKGTKAAIKRNWWHPLPVGCCGGMEELKKEGIRNSIKGTKAAVKRNWWRPLPVG